MRITGSDAPWWGVLCVIGTTTGCPQLARDEFDRVDAPCAAGASGQAGRPCANPDIRLAADAGSSSAPDVCTVGGGVRGPNGCYFVDPAETTWSEARARCQRRGAGWDLATIGSAEDNQFVATLAGVEAWLGATDETLEGTWVWAASGTAFFVVGSADAGAAFANWSSGEPNDYDDSDCLRVLETGLWADWDCGGLKGRVCQAPAL